MAQNSLMYECGANQQEQAQHQPALGIPAAWSNYPGGTSMWEVSPYPTHSQHTGPTSLPTNRSSVLGGGVQNVWSPSGGPSQYTSSATRPSGYDQLRSFGDCSADLSSVISSFEQDDQFLGEESWLYTAPFNTIGHETIGAQFDVGVEPSFGSVSLDAIGGRSGASFDDRLGTTITADSPVARRDRRRSSMKGNLEFECPEPGCGWTFKSQADLR
jgi:hypothetical protein